MARAESGAVSRRPTNAAAATKKAVKRIAAKTTANKTTAKKKTAKKTAAKQRPAGTKLAKQTAAERMRAKAAPPNSRKGRPVDADSAVTRQAIVEAATWVFGMHGYEGTSMQAIAERAGITAPTLYHYFPSKVAIFRTVGDEVTADFRRRTDVATAEVEGARLRIAAILRALGEWVIERPEIASFIALYAAEVARNKEVRRISPAERWTEPMEYYASFAREGLERGEICDDLAPETVAGLIQGLIYGMSALVAVSRAFGPPDLIIAAFGRAIEGTVFLDP